MPGKAADPTAGEKPAAAGGSLDLWEELIHTASTAQPASGDQGGERAFSAGAKQTTS